MRLAVVVSLLAISGRAGPSAAQTIEEIGNLDGAHYRIQMPAQWNQQLVVWCDGYSPTPRSFRSGERNSEFAAALVKAGYALAESGYSRGGIAVDEAVQDSDALWRYFQRKYPNTATAYVVGESLGGLIALRAVERFPETYRGGLSFCGMLGTPFDYVRRAFDLLTLFAFFQPATLPSPANVPVNFQPSEDLIRSVAKVLEANPSAAAVLRNESGASDIADLAAILVFHTDLLRDVEVRCGGNPISNTGTLYVVPADVERVNAGVPRVSASARAASCLKGIGAASTPLARPFLALDATRDPVVAGWFNNTYQDRLMGTPAEAWFVRQYIEAKGHCAIPLRPRLEAFYDLVRWAAREDKKPKPGQRTRDE